MDDKIFRQKALERISSPEQLHDFIQVARPSIWLLLAAIIILLFGAAVWAFTDTVEQRDGDGNVTNVHPIEYVFN